jgi:hypothetical protein
MGIKLAEMVKADGVTHHAWLFHCPACDAVHQCDDRWSFNGDQERPTFGGSVLVHEGSPDRARCHSVVTDGRIAYCEDCSHSMKSQTVDLPDWDSRHTKDFKGVRGNP